MANTYTEAKSTEPMARSTLDRGFGELEENLTALEDSATSLGQYLTGFRGSRPEVAARQKDALSQGNYLARLERLVDQFAEQIKELRELG